MSSLEIESFLFTQTTLSYSYTFESKQTTKNNKSWETCMKSHYWQTKIASLFMQFGFKNYFQNICWSWLEPYKPRINNMAYQCINKTKKTKTLFYQKVT
jgi:hypothetical protein